MQPGEQRWGESVGGLAISLSLVESSSPAKAKFSLAIHNSGDEAVAPADANAVCGWFVLSVGGQDNRKTMYTARVKISDLPAKLEPGKQAQIAAVALTAGTIAWSGRDDARQLLTAYLSGKADADLPKPSGSLGELASSGRGTARFTIAFVPENGKLIALKSNVVEYGEARKVASSNPAVAALLERFDRSAGAAMGAHDEAVKMGKDIAADLAAAASDVSRPDFSRMWLATALADIPCPTAAKTLTTLLNDKLQAVAMVVAFHGPKQKDDALDKAIVARAAAAGSDFVSYAIWGFLVHRGGVGDDLLALGVDNKDPKVRAAVARALAGQMSDENVVRLRKLAADKDERVKATAQKVLDAIRDAGDK